MFAAASGARLAHRHKEAIRKQISTSQIEGLHVQCKGYPKHHGPRYEGHKHLSTKFYPGPCKPGLKLSSSYLDINGRISKFGHVDFEAALFLREKQELRKKKLKIRRRRYELPAHVATRDIAPFPQFPPNSWGKAAWQDRELCHESEARESICIPSEAAVTHRTKQREAHRRWVKRNRIHDLSFGDCSSDEEFFYGVQNGAANLLLYVGLGTMCVGMIIAFVGTGEKGFKTMELRLIGPSLIGAGVLIIILRVLLCVCPSKCLKLKKHNHKLKNSTNKLNSERNETSQELSISKETVSDGATKEKAEKPRDGKKRVSIAMLPTTSGISTNSSEKEQKTPTCPDASGSVPTISFLEFEKPSSWKSSSSRKIPNLNSEDVGEKPNLELTEINEDTLSFESENSCKKFSNLTEMLVSPDPSDISITSLINVSPQVEQQEAKEVHKETKTSKFEARRSPKNLALTEIVLTPFNLNEANEA